MPLEQSSCSVQGRETQKKTETVCERERHSFTDMAADIGAHLLVGSLQVPTHSGMLTASLSEFLEHHSVPNCEFHFIKGSFNGPLVYLATLSLKAHLSVLTSIHTFVLSIVMLHQVNLGFSNLSSPHVDCQSWESKELYKQTVSQG